MLLIPFTFRLLQPFEVFSLDVNTLFKSRNPFCKDRDLEFYRFTLTKLVNCTAKCILGFITTSKSLQITLKSNRDGSHPNRQRPIAMIVVGRETLGYWSVLKVVFGTPRGSDILTGVELSRWTERLMSLFISARVG